MTAGEMKADYSVPLGNGAGWVRLTVTVPDISNLSVGDTALLMDVLDRITTFVETVCKNEGAALQVPASFPSEDVPEVLRGLVVKAGRKP